MKQFRLDFFSQISETLTNSVPNVIFENNYRSDHSPLILKCKVNEFMNGKGNWKFNNFLLVDTTYIISIKNNWGSKKRICLSFIQYR